MANIHTFSQLNSSNNSQRNNIAYSPLNTSQPAQNRGPSNIISMGNFSSPNGEGSQGSAPKVNLFYVIFPGFRFKSFTFIISVIQVLMFLITASISWTIKNDGGFNCLLYRFGAKYTPAVVVFHHFHRLILPVFLHANFMHILFNMISQWIYGFKLEEVYGLKKFIFLYFFAGFGGNMLSTIKETETISVGASSALFGIFAFQVVYLIENYENLGSRRNIMIILMIVLILANFGNGNENKNVDNSSHIGKNSFFIYNIPIGGLITGAVVAIQFMNRDEDPE